MAFQESRWDKGQERTYSILAQFWTKGWIQDSFFFLLLFLITFLHFLTFLSVTQGIMQGPWWEKNKKHTHNHINIYGTDCAQFGADPIKNLDVADLNAFPSGRPLKFAAFNWWKRADPFRRLPFDKKVTRGGGKHR